MRLIDADEATRISKEHTGKRLLAIDTAPTVEAVPVEWIKNQIKDHPGMHAASWSRLLELWEAEGEKMVDNRKRWIDATFKLIEYRRTLESLMNPDAEVFDMAVQAMRRQAPEKPKKELDWTDTCYKYYCPACGMFFGQRGKRDVSLFNRPPYCNCGQAIDWMEEEQEK